MPMTADAFFTNSDLIAIFTGLPMDRAPVLLDRTTGASAVCSPTEISGICASFAMVPCRTPRRRDNAWWCSLPIEAETAEVGLSVIVGEVVHNATVRRRPEPEPMAVPEPAPAPKRTRRARKASS